MRLDDRKDDWNPATRSDWLFVAALIVAGTAISALSVIEIKASEPHRQVAQATQPQPPSSPSDVQKKDEPAPSTTGEARPTTPAPEPARPDADAQKAGAQPALPPAPAEKTAAPIKER